MNVHRPSALLSNSASRTAGGEVIAVDLLRRGFEIRKLFTPEHGMSAKGDDGCAQGGGVDAATGLPLISLYGERFMPGPKDLRDVEVVYVDLPNIGCRFYTYWWTISYMMEACVRDGKKLILLDRPNLSGRALEAVEGPMLDEEQCASFLGRWRMPLTYAGTYGDLLAHFVRERQLELDYEVIPYSGLPLPFVAPSPAMPTQATTLIYPCTGLFEGLNLNCGRGTDLPFHVLGAPWIVAEEFLQAFTALALPGITAETITYTPEWSNYAHEPCHGLRFHITDALSFRPVRSGLLLMNCLSILYPKHLRPQSYPTHANPSGQGHLDLLLGIKGTFERFCCGKPLNKIDLDQALSCQSL
jgi:uncharacterized protein YbbC (DUF1343 family)